MLGGSGWKPALLHAILICLFVLSLFYYWFGVADRYVMFLYNHMGATPFDKLTSSRYWMSGLVASGAVMVLYAMANWLLGRVAGLHYRNYCPPAWWRVWLLCMTPLAVGIPAITMTVNWPRLPPAHAASCAVAALTGLALALGPSSLAAQRPSELGWLVFCGIGLTPSLLLLRAIELPSRALISVPRACLLAVGGTSAGVVWLGMVSWLRALRHESWIEPRSLFLSGLCLSYVLMPLLHYLLLVPPRYRYISASSNFFAFRPGIQFASLFVAAILAIGTARLQRRLQRLLRSRSRTGRETGR